MTDRKRVDLDREGNVIPRDWGLEPTHECAAFSPAGGSRYVGYGETEQQAEANARMLFLSMGRPMTPYRRRGEG